MGARAGLVSAAPIADKDAMTDRLPVDDALPALMAALTTHGRAVLQAPPGAGKTTHVPLAMLDAGVGTGRTLMLEPRRLAARAAAERMAALLGEPVGRTVGYRMRGAARVSKTTRIEVVTEGILTRILQSDPGLDCVGAVIFDEFHERSLNADLGLALAWEARGALRPDLVLLVMSATLDAEPVAALLDDAPIVTAEGRAYPVETRWRNRPLPAGTRFEDEAAALVRRALDETDGGVLVFLPGAAEIGRVAARLKSGLPDGTRLHRLYGAATAQAQRAALAPEPARKLVLATAIAETSLTIPGIAAVVDCGRARRARYDPGSGMARLVTERVSHAEADQRRGRAGRTGPGVAYRMWARAEEGAMPAFAPPEIDVADLTGLALDLAVWGAAPGDLAFLTPPPHAGLARARPLLSDLGAIDASGRVTDHGRALARLPLHPRLAHMLVRAGPRAASLAALLNDRDPLRTPGSVDIAARLTALGGKKTADADAPALARIRTEAKRLARLVSDPPEPITDPGEATALAYPDRIGMRRQGDNPRFVLSGGKGAVMDAGDALAGTRLIVVAETDGRAPEARIRLAASLTEAGLRALYGDRIEWQEEAVWSRRTNQAETRRREKFGALILRDEVWRDAPHEAVAQALTEGLRARGLAALALGSGARRLMDRVEFLRARETSLPDLSAPGLLKAAEKWFSPLAGRARRLEDLGRTHWAGAIAGLLTWEQRQLVDRLAPLGITTPLGRSVAVDYSGDQPGISLKLQEMFGQSTHPTVGPDQTPLLVTLLSPAGRPLQVTSDLAGFWATSYSDVRRDMRGRYPKHPWPEDPLAADPTSRAKPRH